jgi:hypothetical protein
MDHGWAGAGTGASLAGDRLELTRAANSNDAAMAEIKATTYVDSSTVNSPVRRCTPCYAPRPTFRAVGTLDADPNGARSRARDERGAVHRSQSDAAVTLKRLRGIERFIRLDLHAEFRSAPREMTRR